MAIRDARAVIEALTDPRTLYVFGVIVAARRLSNSRRPRDDVLGVTWGHPPDADSAVAAKLLAQEPPTHRHRR
jgi:hypothetical protein